VAVAVGARPYWGDLDLRARFVDVGDVSLHAIEAGDGPLVLLLHGFPEFWYGWRDQIGALVGAGHRVVAPDQRGYGLSDKPGNWREYGVEALTSDAARLIEASGERRAAVVGHGWGGLVGYYLAMLYPERVERLAVLSAAHPQRSQAAPRGRRKRRTGGALHPSRTIAEAAPGTFSEEDVSRYRAAWAQPGAAKAMVDWYRAYKRRTEGSLAELWRVIHCPTLVLWGERERCTGPELAVPHPYWVPNARVEILPGLTHWLQHEDPRRVNALLVEFLGGSSPQDALA
jgi:pimeloyl-ACP methyl ester carboxylesterase